MNAATAVVVDDPQAPPDRSPDQRLEALKRANATRAIRADLKKRVKAGKKKASRVVLDPAPEFLTMRIYDLMMAMPKVGWVKVTRTMNTCRISHSKTIGGLSKRQRDELVAAMQECERKAAKR